MIPLTLTYKAFGPATSALQLVKTTLTPKVT